MENNILFVNNGTCNLIINPSPPQIPVNTNPDIIIKQKMYYDIYDREDGIGFYPQMRVIQDTTIFIHFRLFVYSLNALGWLQNSGPVIYGFIKRDGVELLNSLNNAANVNAIVISNAGGRIVYPMMYSSTDYILENYSK